MLQKGCSMVLSALLILLGIIQPPLSFAQERNEYTIAVLDLNADGISESEARTLSANLRGQVIEIVSSEAFREATGVQYTVIERSQMDKIFEQFDIQNIGCTDLSCAVEFGKMLSTERIIIGSIGLVGKTYSIQARIVDVESSKIIAVSSYVFTGQRDNLLTTGIPTVANELMYGKKKKSRKIYYIVGGVVLLGGVAAAVLSGGSGDGGVKPGTTGEIVFTIPDPSE